MYTNFLFPYDINDLAKKTVHKRTSSPELRRVTYANIHHWLKVWTSHLVNHSFSHRGGLQIGGRVLAEKHQPTKRPDQQRPIV